MRLIAISRWPLQHKLMAGLGLCLAVFVAVSVASGLWLSGEAMERRVISDELPAVLSAVRNDIQRQVTGPLGASLDMADNHFLLAWERAGQPEEGLASFQAFAARLKARHRAQSVFWVSQANGRYLTEAGTQRLLGPQDTWFGRFLTSGLPYALDLAPDPRDETWQLRVHARFDAGPGHLGAAGLGVSAAALAEQVTGRRVGQTGLLMLVRPDGSIVLHRDALLGDGRHHLGDLPGFGIEALGRLLSSNGEFSHTVEPAEGGTRILAASYVPELNLYLVATVPRAELLAAATRAAWQAPLLAAGVVGLLGLVLIALLPVGRVAPGVAAGTGWPAHDDTPARARTPQQHAEQVMSRIGDQARLSARQPADAQQAPETRKTDG